jgi:beta-glucosidase
MERKAPATLIKNVRRLQWEGGPEASFGGDFQAERYSGVFDGTYTATATETLELVLFWDHGALFDFGNLAHVDKWEWTVKGNVTVQVNVTAGETYPVHVAYRHEAGSTRFHFTLGRRITVEQSLKEAQAKAAESDVILFVGGISAVYEGEEMHTHPEGFDGGDRTVIELPRVQRSFLEGLKQTGKPIIFLLCQGSATVFELSGLSAVVNAWYPGQEGSAAIAEVLFGDYNPAGRLPVTFYSSTHELNEFHDYNLSAGKGRTYRYYKGKPLFPFGYGLSYTKFHYRDLRVMGDYTKGQPVDVSFIVQNIGDLAGDEVSQVYVSAIDVPGEPIKSLRWFKRQQFEVAEQIEFVARLHNEAFMIYDEAKDELVLRPGKFRIAVGGSSGDEDLIWKDVSFPNVIVEAEKPFGGYKSSGSWNIGVIGGLVGIVIVAVTIGIVYRLRSHGSEPGCHSEPLLSQ